MKCAKVETNLRFKNATLYFKIMFTNSEFN